MHLHQIQQGLQAILLLLQWLLRLIQRRSAQQRRLRGSERPLGCPMGAAARRVGCWAAWAHRPAHGSTPEFCRGLSYPRSLQPNAFHDC